MPREERREGEEKEISEKKEGRFYGVLKKKETAERVLTRKCSTWLRNT